MQFDGQKITAQVVRERHCDLDGNRFYVRNPYAMDGSAELGRRDHHGQPDASSSPAAGSDLRFTLFRKQEVVDPGLTDQYDLQMVEGEDRGSAIKLTTA